MKPAGGMLGRRPWLLVIVAFLLLIAGWVATYSIASRQAHQKLTPEQEAALLGGGRP